MGQGIASYAQRMVQDAAAPVSPGEKIKAQINRACVALGYPIGHWRVRAAWNNEAECWSARALKELEGRYQAWKQRQKKLADAEAIKAAALYAAIASTLENTDEEFHRQDIAALLDLARRLGSNADGQVK